MSNARKDRVRSEATRLLAAGVAGRVFPGGSACVAWRDGNADVYAEAAAGKLTEGGANVEISTPYDLASITKPFVAMLALRLVAQGKLALDSRADSLVSDVRGGAGGSATLEQLLTHRAGLSPWGGLFLDVPHEPGTSAARRWIIGEASRRPDETGAARKQQAVYSDLGYLIAGEMIARASGLSLDRALQTHVLEPLGIADDVYFAGTLPPDKKTSLIRRTAPTERCEWRGRLIRGEVHDENAAALGGVAGNAGLFGNAKGVAVFGRAMLDVLAMRSDFLPPKLLQEALAERPGGTYRLGWDTRSAEGSSAGRRMSQSAFGHLGFTGTSVWCDPEKDIVVVLLSNRVHPSRANERIKGFRPAFHDGVIAALES
ncbi:MAG: beta-lactamase family protein [Sandaracinaceae bacterium]|nr:beta-lactamase family protein [Sandaracinaceae bacterium]